MLIFRQKTSLLVQGCFLWCILWCMVFIYIIFLVEGLTFIFAWCTYEHALKYLLSSTFCFWWLDVFLYSCLYNTLLFFVGEGKMSFMLYYSGIYFYVLLMLKIYALYNKPYILSGTTKFLVPGNISAFLDGIVCITTSFGGGE